MVKVLTWLINHGNLMTNRRELVEGSQEIPTVDIALTVRIEDLDHLFRRCTKARPVWHILNVHANKDGSQPTTFRQWFINNLRDRRYVPNRGEWKDLQR